MTMLPDDLTVLESEDRIAFGNAHLYVVISKASGEWLSFVVDGLELINHGRGPQIPADFKVDGVWQVETHGARYLSHEVEDKGAHDPRATLYVHLGVQELPASFGVPASLLTCAAGPRYAYRLTCSYELDFSQMTLRRRLSVTRHQDVNYNGVRSFRFEEFLFKLPGVVVVGSDCTVEMPGPIPPWLVLKPRLPYAEAKQCYFSRRTAPDFDLGIVLLHHPETNTTLSTWLETTETYYMCHLAGDGESLTVALNETYANWILDAGTVRSHENVIRLSSGISEALQHYGAYIRQAAPPMTNVPAWVERAVLMEVDTHHYGGFTGLQEKLPYLSDVGINALYLLPINEGGYRVSDHYRIDPALGTVEDLKAMIAEAHRLGIRVLLDLLITILTRDSEVALEHPEYFQRDESGRIVPHFKWDNAATDPASPEFRRYIAEFATYCVRDLGVDGFRVDAASADTPNWDPHSGRAPWRSQLGTFGLMAEVNRAIKAVKPEAILLDELGGPIFFHVSDICHNFGFVHQVFWDENKAQGYTVRSYKHLLADVADAMPPASLRVFYVRNHDAAWFTRFDGYTPEFFAYEAMHAFVKGIPLIFSGQDRWPGPTPSDFDYYRRLFQLRREHAALMSGVCLYREIDTDSDHVFSVIRALDDEVLIVLVSALDTAQRVKVTVGAGVVDVAEGPVALVDVYGGERITVPSVQAFEVDLEPFGIRVFRPAYPGQMS